MTIKLLIVTLIGFSWHIDQHLLHAYNNDIVNTVWSLRSRKKISNFPLSHSARQARAETSHSARQERPDRSSRFPH